MVHLIGEHGAQDGMAEMIVALVARKVGEQVLDGVIDVFLCRDELVISVLWRLPVLFRALLGGLRRGEHGVGRQHAVIIATTSRTYASGFIVIKYTKS